jgi:hypothetical protein
MCACVIACCVLVCALTSAYAPKGHDTDKVCICVCVNRKRHTDSDKKERKKGKQIRGKELLRINNTPPVKVPTIWTERERQKENRRGGGGSQ